MGKLERGRGRKREVVCYGNICYVRSSRGAEGPSACFEVASGGDLSDEYEHDGPGVCLGDGQTEAYLMNMSMTGLASAWAMARRRPI